MSFSKNFSCIVAANPWSLLFVSLPISSRATWDLRVVVLTISELREVHLIAFDCTLFTYNPRPAARVGRFP
jgi:hypothetical protein